jgi:hypothetical protein
MSGQPFRKTLPGKLVMTVAALAACYLAIDAYFRTLREQYFPERYEDPLFVMGTFLFVACPLVLALVVTIHFHLRRHREPDAG